MCDVAKRVQRFAAELDSLAQVPAPDLTKVRALEVRLRDFVLRANATAPLMDEARQCAQMLNRLSKLRKGGRG